jgi:putative FmdB family regulatory protein
MPTYEYVCEKCGHQFEKFQSIKDKSLATCPEELCGLKKWGKGKVKKLISAGAGLIFKGSGFYITDYRSDKYKEAAKKESGAATPSTGGESKTGGAAAGDSKTPKSESKAPPKKPEPAGS